MLASVLLCVSWVWLQWFITFGCRGIIFVIAILLDLKIIFGSGWVPSFLLVEVVFFVLVVKIIIHQKTKNIKKEFFL
jgi:hypothetical protein